MLARLQPDAAEPGTGFLIREDSEHLAGLPERPQIQVRAGTFAEEDATVCVALAQIESAGSLYETWLNYHNPAHRLCLEDLARQTALTLRFYVNGEEPARTICLVENPLADFAAQMLIRLPAAPSWGMEQFDSARQAVQSRYPTARALWAAVGAGVPAEETVGEQPVTGSTGASAEDTIAIPPGEPTVEPSVLERTEVSEPMPAGVTEQPEPQRRLTPAPIASAEARRARSPAERVDDTWFGAVIPCPGCRKAIPQFAIACPYCGASILTVRTGYCSRCRAVVGVTAAGTCQDCGAGAKDVRVEHTVMPEAAPEVTFAAAMPVGMQAPVRPGDAGTQGSQALRVGGGRAGTRLPRDDELGLAVGRPVAAPAGRIPSNPKRSWWGRRSRGAKIALILAGVVVLGVLAGQLVPLIMDALRPSDAELVQTLATTTDEGGRQEAAADLATRHSFEATQDLADKAATDATARAGLSALRDAYIAGFDVDMDDTEPGEREAALKDTARCLGAIGDADSIDALAELSCTSRCDIVSVRVVALEALADTGESVALPHLIEALVLPTSVDPAGEIGTAASAALVGFPGAVTALIDAWADSTGLTRPAIEEVLALTGGPAVEPLVAQFYVADWTERVLADIGTTVIPAVSRELTSPQRVVRHRALGVLLRLYERDNPTLTPYLVKTDLLGLLVEARFLAHYGDERDSAAEAVIAAIGEPAVDSLIGLLGETDWADGVLAEIGPAAISAVSQQLGRGEPAVRYRALGVLLRLCITDKDLVAPELVREDRIPLLIEARNEAGYGDERDTMIAAVLTEIGEPAAEALVGILPSFWAGDVLAGMGETAVPALQSALKSTNRDTRFSAADVLVQMHRSEPDSVAEFMSALEEDGLKFIATNYAFYIRLGQEGTEDILIRALNKYARRNTAGETMVEDYLNCGNEKLDAGARQWCADHGYTVETLPGAYSGPQWGEGG